MIVALAALLFFLWIAIEVARGDTLGFDLAVRGAVHAWASPLLTQAMRGVTLLGEPWLLIPLGLLFSAILMRRGRAHAAVTLAAAAVGGQILNSILKEIVRRPRPEAFFGFPQPLDYSFPSGHAMASTCFYVAVAAILGPRKTAHWAFGIAAPLLIGFSRVYLGVHYPTDVLGGYAAAVVWLIVLFRCNIRLIRPSLRSK